MHQTVHVDALEVDVARLDISEFAQISKQTSDPPGRRVELFHGVQGGVAVYRLVLDKGSHGCRRGAKGCQRVLQFVVQADEHPVAVGKGLGLGSFVRLSTNVLFPLLPPAPREEDDRGKCYQPQKQKEQKEPNLDFKNKELSHA